jgi:hypothetical protein
MPRREDMRPYGAGGTGYGRRFRRARDLGLTWAAIVDRAELTSAMRVLRAGGGTRLPAVVGAGWVIATAVLVDLGIPVAVAVSAAAVYLVLGVALGLRLLRSSGEGYWPSRRVRETTLVSVAVWYTAGTTVLLRFWPGVDLHVAALVAVASAVPVGRKLGRDLADGMGERLEHAAALESLDDAQDMVDACRRRLAERGLDDAQRVALTVNLAHALVTRSTRGQNADGLVEAIGLMAPIVEDSSGDPDTVLRAADELVTAVGVQVYKHGDTRGWQEALALLTTAARRAPGAAVSPQAQLAEAIVAAAAADGKTGGPLSGPERAAAVHRLDELASARDEHVSAYARLALARLLGAPGALEEELDRAIDLARGVSSRRLPRPWGPIPGVTLAVLLHERASRGGASAAADTEEAAVWCVGALHDERNSGTAALILAQVLRVRESLGLGALPRPVRHRGHRLDIGAAYRLAHAALARSTDYDPSVAAHGWAEWAMARNDVPEAAEALWRLATGVRTESSRRFTRAGRERVVGSVQGVVAEAGHWLARAGRLTDAVVAMECGRGVLLGGHARHVDPGVPAALAARGRHDLWLRWLDAADRLDALHRSQFVRADTGSRAPAGPGDLVSDELRAWSAYDQASHAMVQELGRPPDPLPSYQRLLRAAAGTVVVYLGSARQGGDALVVGVSDRPRHVSLPELTAAAVESRVRHYLAARSDETEKWPRVLEETLDWLAGAFVGPLLPHLPHRDELTVIPTGLLGLLPLHATPLPEHRGQSGARPAFLLRYAPNARVEGLARGIATRLAGGALTVAAVSAPHPPGHRPLNWAHAEVAEVGRVYGPACTPVPGAMKREAVRALRHATVWHIACHGVSQPDRPLDSAIVLEDGPLRLREVLAWPPGEHRLAVLSACETDTPDPSQMDEVVSLPGALLRAGVAGVVASQWRVGDQATALLMARFHARLSEGEPPSRALADAQEWLRTATNDRLSRAYPELANPPPSLPDRAVALWRGQVPFRHARYWAAFCLTGT